MPEEVLENPMRRDRDYAGNAARYLVDLHEKRAVFDFCGGMMFQLVLTDALVEKLKGPDAPKVVIHDAATRRMAQVPGYDKSNFADVAGFRERYGPNSFTLNHRFYLHLDNTNQLWLSA